MTATTGRDLGHGVRVMPGDGDGIVVLSVHFDLGWRARAVGRPGSAVVWQDGSFEVVDREPWRAGFRWTLAPWDRNEVMRVVQPLDEASVAAAAETIRHETRATKLRPALWLLSPVLGFAVAGWQRRWRDAWGFPAVLATWLTAILEAIFGALCLIEAIASVGAGEAIFDWIPRPLVLPGLYLFVEGLFRVVRVAADSEPVGSLVGAVAAVFERPPPPASAAIVAPVVQSNDGVAGILELASTMVRRDWEIPGVLAFRGDSYVLDGTRSLGDSWIYRFRRLAAAEPRPEASLRLLPPRTQPRPPARASEPGALQTVLLSIACTLAQGRFQTRWARRLGVRATWFTVLGASAELIGGWSNLAAGGGGGGLALLLNLYFVVEAVARFLSVALRGEPMGSVFGLPLQPVLERHLPETGLD